MIKVLIADDHPLVRKGIKTYLDIYDDIEIVGEAENGAEAIAMCKISNPDIVLMDLVMPEVDGVEATRKILQSQPSIKIIILTSFIDKNLLENSLKAGAIGYVLKNISGESLIKTLRNANMGKSTLSSEASDFLISRLKNSQSANYYLTNQEKKILEDLIQGLSNKQIAQAETLSISTVKFHVSNILSKLGAASRAEAISIALKNKSSL
ncbi:MAG: response regulator transcription factor [Actinobacteria bacterium]|nr:response regulator transcription factor [Actinomycetota bacterium]